jgi:uncharacterized protein (TIGR03084 family)
VSGLPQAADFLDECEALHQLLHALDDAAFDRQTLFKGWTFNNILRHLHVWNIAAGLSLTDETAFTDMMRALLRSGGAMQFIKLEEEFLQGLSGQALLAGWIDHSRAIAVNFGNADPKRRLKWVGPDMSALSSISARLMETWAHAQAIYDALGIERHNTDRIGNIARLGVNTYRWTFKNRGRDIPQPMPHVRLTAPSGAIWNYGETSEAEFITGDAVQFCQVVTQTRNIADTTLAVFGPNANAWMAIAQCFAGAPNDPPAKGLRHKA